MANSPGPRRNLIVRTPFIELASKLTERASCSPTCRIGVSTLRCQVKKTSPCAVASRLLATETTRRPRLRRGLDAEDRIDARGRALTPALTPRRRRSGHTSAIAKSTTMPRSSCLAATAPASRCGIDCFSTSRSGSASTSGGELAVGRRASVPLPADEHLRPSGGGRLRERSIRRQVGSSCAEPDRGVKERTVG